ncbi:MAG TPA: metal ABC transporter substrate-binding protein [Xanthobacteraceae bacterium]
MLYRRTFLAAALLLAAAPAMAQEKLSVVATFSILGDFVKNVGGERVMLTTLVGPNGDAHVYAPSPADARKLFEAKLVIVNGLRYEGWIDRLVKASGTKAALAVASKGVKARETKDAHGHADAHALDPHAWQSVANAKTYVVNIRDALTLADPAGKDIYAKNAADYLRKLDALEAEIKAAVAAIPAARRKIITTHDAFGYFRLAYGIEFITPQGVSTDAEASAQDVARIIRQIKAQKIPAVFLENVSDPRLIKRIADETGARIGGTLFSDALSDDKGPAPTYIDMMRHNVKQLAAALTS